jgi:hypothetical protein
MTYMVQTERFETCEIKIIISEIDDELKQQLSLKIRIQPKPITHSF